MATLILIRHGQSLGNAERRFTRGPDEPLTDRGREEARAAGQLVAARWEPVALYASPFLRAHETARLVGAAVGLEPEIVEDLREQHFGELHGRPYAEWTAAAEAGGAPPWERRPPGGETLREVARRAGRALDAIARRHAGVPVVVVSHGGVMAALRAHAAAAFDALPEVARNATGYVLTHDGTRYNPPEPLEQPD